MGMVSSIFCTMTFCIERILTCTCCAFLLILMLFGILLMLVYGVSIGYHFSQKELSNYAVSRRDDQYGPGVPPSYYAKSRRSERELDGKKQFVKVDPANSAELTDKLVRPDNDADYDDMKTVSNSSTTDIDTGEPGWKSSNGNGLDTRAVERTAAGAHASYTGVHGQQSEAWTTKSVTSRAGSGSVLSSAGNRKKRSVLLVGGPTNYRTGDGRRATG